MLEAPVNQLAGAFHLPRHHSGSDYFERGELYCKCCTKVVDSERLSVSMNFRLTMMKVKSRLLDQIGTSLQL